MALAKDARPQVEGSESVVADKQGQSLLPPRHLPQQSDIRELDADELEAKRAFDLIGDEQRHSQIWPPPLALDAAIEQYTHFAQKDSLVLHALRIGDLPQAIVTLMQENFQLRQEIESKRADFEELRSVNLALQEQAHASLGVADDQRLELLEELERTRCERTDIEGQLERLERDYQNDLQDIGQQRNALDLENIELRAQLANCTAGIGTSGK